MNLVVGATGVLGSEVCRLLAEQGKPVKALVRSTSAPDGKSGLQKLGVELVEGDLRDSSSLEHACRGIENVFSTATSIVHRQPEDSFEQTDRDGHLSLIEAAEKAGAQRFVFVSVPPIRLENPLQSAKRKVEERLKAGRLTYTSLQPAFFQEIWLGPHLGFDARNGNVRIYGSGKNKMSWISYRDVAQFAVLSIQNRDCENRLLPIGGPEDLSPLEVVKIFEEISGKEFKVEHVPAEVLKAQYESTADPYQKTFSALMLGYNDGCMIPMNEVLQSMPVNLRSVRDYALSILTQ